MQSCVQIQLIEIFCETERPFNRAVHDRADRHDAFDEVWVHDAERERDETAGRMAHDGHLFLADYLFNRRCLQRCNFHQVKVVHMVGACRRVVPDEVKIMAGTERFEIGQHRAPEIAHRAPTVNEHKRLSPFAITFVGETQSGCVDFVGCHVAPKATWPRVSQSNGAGSIFIFNLSACQSLAAMALKVLIVDDSQIMRDVIQKFLAGFDLEIAGTARDGEEAIQLFRELQPDIVTLDITMPRIDGLAALKEMKKINAEAQIMIVSAINDKSVVLKALDAGAALFVNKPVSADAVKAAIGKLLAQRKP